MFPTMNATTTAVFEALGVEPQTFLDTIMRVVNISVNFLLWQLEAFWPLYLILFFVLAIVGYAKGWLRIGGRH